jgi:hypothetical protein
MRSLIAIEPRSYREVIGSAIQHLRPHIEVLIVEPEELVEEVVRLDPELVICSTPDTRMGSSKHSWVEYRPYEETACRVSVGSKNWQLKNVGFKDLLSVVDQTEKLVQRKNPLRNN